jgi:nucleoside-diphosphate-sugar epimerase
MVFIRSPLVYGAGAKGNFASMVNCLARGIPLPLGAVIHNRRSLVSLGNLIDLIVTCLDHPAASNRTFLISDGEDLSTADLLRRLAIAMGKPARLFSVPPSWLQVVASLVGKPDIARRLLGNLQVEISYTCRTLRWKPPISVDQGFSQAVRDMNL